MPDLHQTLRSTDFDFLQRIANAWKIELKAKSFIPALTEIESLMLEKPQLEETLNVLPENAHAAWEVLLARHGRESWAIFTRQFGELRPFGLARRSREQPDLSPISAVEVLWYRGLIGRAFLNPSGEPQEYAYIPDEFLAMTQQNNPMTNQLLPRPASEADSKIQLLANDALLDDATEALAALRMNRPLHMAYLPKKPVYIQFLLALLAQVGLFSAEQLPEPEKVKDFLSESRGEALLNLFNIWRNSQSLNELRMLPGLTSDGNWTNNPQIPRNLLIEILKPLDVSTWWSIPSLLNQVKTTMPDFQRPAGDYDSWFIHEEKTNQNLRGFESWDKVEGALLRYLLAGPLHWLGVLDIAHAEKTNQPISFRLSPIGVNLLQNQIPAQCSSENGSVTISSDGSLFITHEVPRALRYQLERFCLPLGGEKSQAKYQVTADSLRQAVDQGLRPTQLIYLLQQARVKNIPQVVSDALERWEKYGPEMKVQPVVLLRLEKNELLPIFQKVPRVARCLGEVLNPLTVIVKPGSTESLRQALAELGFIADIQIDKVV